MQRSTWQAAILLILAALAGGAVGSLVTARSLTGHHGGPDRGHGSDWYVDLLDNELDLTAAQRDSVRTILERHRHDMDSVWAQLDPKMTDLRDVIRSEVRAVLTPAQQDRYSTLTARLDAERWDKKREPRHHDD